jgi:cytochrome c
MKDLELNKIAAAVLLAGLIAMVSGKIADILYHPENATTRGFEVEVVEETQGEEVAEEVVIDIPALMAAADAAAGQDFAKRCVACHSFDQGGPNKVGPVLFGAYGRSRASVSGYAYSDALKALGGTWDEESLFKFLENPRKYAPGNKMGFAGIRNHQDLANMIAYLKQQR